MRAHPARVLIPLIAPLTTVLAGLVLGATDASAATLPGDLIPTPNPDAQSLLCLDRWSIGSWLTFDPHVQGAGSCEGLRGVGFAMLALVAIVTIALGRMRLRAETQRFELAQRFVEQGLEPPAGLLMGPARADQRKGVVLMFAGAGVFIAGLWLGDRGLAAVGLVPEFIGIGYLISYWLASRIPGEGGRGG